MKYLSDFSCDCDIGGGGLLITSKRWFDNFSEELAYSLCIVLDVDGRTNQIYDYPDQCWNDVWKAEINKWLPSISYGDAALIIFREGKYNITFNLNNNLSYNLFQNNKLQHFSNLKVEDSEIYIVEAGDFLMSYFSDILEYEDEDFEKINLPYGFYKIYCSSKKDTNSGSSFDVFFYQVESLSTNNNLNELIHL